MTFTKMTTVPLFLGLLFSNTVQGLPYDHLDDQVNAAIDAGTFANPSNLVRPKFRYWLPDASINITGMQQDIADIGKVGAGGIELLNYYMYGGVIQAEPVPVDWDFYNFGTDAYVDVLKGALEATQANGLIMDFEVGVQSGQGAPAEPGNPGLSWEMDANYVILSPGETFNDQVPGYNTTSGLLSVLTATVLNSTVDSSNRTLYTLAEASVVDVTQNVTTDGYLNVTFSNDTALGYLVFAGYAVQPLTRSGTAGSDPQNFIKNGSFAVDHFSAVGAKLTTDFLEEYVLLNGTKELLMEVGNYIWEDSMEIAATTYWTPNLTTNFEAQHGYSILTYLPLLLLDNANGLTAEVTEGFVTDASDAGSKYVTDFRSTLALGYADYLNHWTYWSNSLLDLQFSAQIGYNMPIDMLQNIDLVNAPETETLAFANDVDAMLQYSGAANLAGKRIISIEAAANFDEAYQMTLPTLLQNTQRGLAAGVNMFIYHGATYTYDYPNTTWPGFTTFMYEFGEMHSRHQPAWEHGYADVLNWTARVQYIQQSGVPKRDIVFWDYKPAQGATIPALYSPTDLTSAGYTYDYLSPTNFDLPWAVVENGTFAPEGAEYRALVIRSNDTLTAAGVGKLLEFAQAGLPIVAAGGFPTSFSSTNATAVLYVNTTLSTLSSLSNVHIIDDSPIASSLQSLGIKPRLSVSSNGLWWTTWRSNGTSEYIFIFNDGAATSGTITFSSTATPYFLDLWSGIQTPILNYTTDGSSTTMYFSFAGNQTAVIAFSDSPLDPSVEIPSVHATSATSSILGFSYDSSSSGLIAKVASSSDPQTLTLSNSTIITLDSSSVPDSFTLDTWTLTAEHWDPPSDLYTPSIDAVKSDTTHNLTSPLLPWPSIPGLNSTSGLGFYNTSFTWPPSTTNSTSTNSTLGAYISFPPVFHSLEVFINGVEVGPLDYTNPIGDISEYLVEGENVVEVTVATTLYNVLKPIWGSLLTASSGSLVGADSPEQDVGLVGTVEVVPYWGVVVA